jgi:hypothetical protein
MMQNDCMRVTVDIDEAVLKELSRLSGEKKNSPAIAKVVKDWVRRQKAKEFGNRIMEGFFDYPLTNDQIEEADG